MLFNNLLNLFVFSQIIVSFSGTVAKSVYQTILRFSFGNFPHLYPGPKGQGSMVRTPQICKLSTELTAQKPADD